MPRIKIATATAAAITLATLAAPAAAQDVYVFGSVGTSETTHEIERNLGANPPMLPVQDASGTTSTQESGLSLLAGVGYEHDIGNTPAYISLEGFYAFEDTQSRNINGVLITDVDLNSRYGARALFGYNVTDNFSVYTHSGMTVLDFDLTNSYTFAPPVTERSDTEVAFSYGAGFTYDLSDSLQAVVDYTQVSEVDFAGIAEVAGNTGRENPNTLAVRTFSSGLRFRF